MTTRLERILGRTERPIETTEPITRLIDQRVLVTGAQGSIGAELTSILRLAGIHVFATDLHGEYQLDVRDAAAVFGHVNVWKPNVILHLAGAKHAPEGEREPWTVAHTNTVGTANIVHAAERYGARVVTASTGKAADPETAYGASKLLAERITLQAGGSVARFHNVVESSGNVFEIWDALHDTEPLPVAPCKRYFISLREAIGLILWAAVLEPGRYMVDSGFPRKMWDVAQAYDPHRGRTPIKARRGDRVDEPRHGVAEEWCPMGAPRGIVQVTSPHETSTGHVVEAAA